VLARRCGTALRAGGVAEWTWANAEDVTITPKPARNCRLPIMSISILL
jgi:hypothetical protein